MKVNEILKKNKIIPIAVFSDKNNALKTAEILLKNSFNLLEITLRTDAAVNCIKEISGRFPEMLLGAGSVLSKEALGKAVDAGASFGVAPALDREVLDFASLNSIPFIPGIYTPTELNEALKTGINIIKLFPASLGGIDYIKAITAPFKVKDFKIVPTGGINEKNIMEFLNLERVIACGLSYIVDSKLIEDGKFSQLEERMIKLREMIIV